MTRTITLTDDVAATLRASHTEGDRLMLPPDLPRPAYVAVNRALEGLGGKWDRRARAHVFPGPAGELVTAALDDGHVIPPQSFGYFPTPPDVAARLVHEARVEPWHTILEPSAGQGALLDAIGVEVPDAALTVIELLEANCAVLREKGYHPVCGDFTRIAVRPVDRVVMNPPFERKADIDHVCRAYGMLKPGGRLAAIMSAGSVQRLDRKTRAFGELLDARGDVTYLPEDAFRESGTRVRTIMVTLDA